MGRTRLGVACTVLVPDRAPQTKLDAITRLGARIVKLPYEQWWNVLVEHRSRRAWPAQFIHPVSDQHVLAGNATVGAESSRTLDAAPAAIFVPVRWWRTVRGNRGRGEGRSSATVSMPVKSKRPRRSVHRCRQTTDDRRAHPELCRWNRRTKRSRGNVAADEHAAH